MSEMRIPEVGETVLWYTHADESSEPVPGRVIERGSNGRLTLVINPKNAHYTPTYSGVPHMSQIADLPTPVRVQVGGWRHAPRELQLDKQFAELHARIDQLESQMTEPKKTKRETANA